MYTKETTASEPDVWIGRSLKIIVKLKNWCQNAAINLHSSMHYIWSVK